MVVDLQVIFLSSIVFLVPRRWSFLPPFRLLTVYHQLFFYKVLSTSLIKTPYDNVRLSSDYVPDTRGRYTVRVTDHDPYSSWSGTVYGVPRISDHSSSKHLFISYTMTMILPSHLLYINLVFSSTPGRTSRTET